jgi:hypothetical protein
MFGLRTERFGFGAVESGSSRNESSEIKIMK